MSSPDSASPIIGGLGTATTDNSMSQEEAVHLAQRICCQTEEQRSLVRVLFRRSGVQRRSTAVPYTRAFDFLDGPAAESAASARAVEGEATEPALADIPATALAPLVRGPTTGERMEWYRAAAGPLALEAAGKALAAAGVEPSSITHSITVTCTGFFAPGIDTSLILGLGLRPTTERVQVGFMGCHGGINGLRAADAIVCARPASRVLLCAVELCSVHFCFEWDPARLVGNAVFGDGAAALVLTSDPTIAQTHKSNGAIHSGAAHNRRDARQRAAQRGGVNWCADVPLAARRLGVVSLARLHGRDDLGNRRSRL